eukprot:TRINITY_DN3776_c0_g1_i1.p1 TRINITY_DN3776_c0_g1~~TRINITY_DN3776_c0_g1_i1.p1  ORF type:complete len:135 (+),score=3.36 TRINITY_DN3776_c0_g1_i1:42-446(+)
MSVAYVVVVLLFIECLVLGFLLLPLPNFIRYPATQALKSLHPYILYTWSGFVVILFFQSYYDMERRETEEYPTDHMSKQQHLLTKFRSERNFYMNLFTLVILIVIWRVRQIVSLISKLQERVDKLQKETENKKQ